MPVFLSSGTCFGISSFGDYCIRRNDRGTEIPAKFVPVMV